MPKVKPVRMCIDRIPTSQQVARFARCATKENPDNEPEVIGVDIAPFNSPLSIAFITAKKWAIGRTLKIAFMGGSKAQHSTVQKHAEEWIQYANLNFKFGVPAAGSDVRISFRPDGAWSYIGTDALGINSSQPTMNLDPSWAVEKGTILHEFGHCLGAIHEHNHPEAGIPWNLDAVYKYFSGPPNFWSKSQIDTNLFARYSRTITNFSAYDGKSIMHYAIDAALLTDPKYAVGWNNTLSMQDRSFVVSVYPGRTKVDDRTVQVPAVGTYTVTESGGKKVIILN